MSFGIPDFRYDEVINQTHIFITSNNSENIISSIYSSTISTTEVKEPQNEVLESST